MDIVISEEKGVRYLHFGSDWVQGAMRVARPYALEFEYTREMMLPLMLRPEKQWPRNALVVGLGVGALPKFLHRHRPDCRITVVEISKAVCVAAQMHFKLPEASPFFQVEVGCGAEYLASTSRSFDLILVDGFDENAKVGDLSSSRFYLNARTRLQAQGLLVVNLLGNQKGFEQNMKRLKEAFDGRAIALSACESGNVVAFATVGESLELEPAELLAQAAHLKAETGLNLSNTVNKIQNLPMRCL